MGGSVPDLFGLGKGPCRLGPAVLAEALQTSDRKELLRLSCSLLHATFIVEVSAITKKIGGLARAIPV
jgi:hypothetical protein